MQHYGDTFIFVLPEEDALHTEDYPFCSVDPACPCHEDPDLIAEVNQQVQEGHLTPDEATRFVQGKTI